MSFRATITSANKQIMWSRVIQTLSSINDDIRFTLATDELILWSMNSTDTTMYQFRLEARFFDEYYFNADAIVFGEEGVQCFKDSRGTEHKTYSFQVNGQHLTVLSRKPEHDAIKEFTFGIDNTATCPEPVVRTLQVHIYTENLITKEYSPGFVPISYDPIVIDLKYKKRFLDVYGGRAGSVDPRMVEFFTQTGRQLEVAKFNQGIVDEVQPEVLLAEHEINFVSMDYMIWKTFIDTCTNVTEEVMLSLNEDKMVITAFTKGIYNLKSQDILKQAISISNSVKTEDLEHFCLFATSGKRDQKTDATKQVVFKLRDFKNFINANQAWKDRCTVNCWFCLPGDPILFEIDRADVKLSLVQITDNSGRLEPTSGAAIIEPTIRSPNKNVTALQRASSRQLHGSKQNPSTFVSLNPPEPARRLFVHDPNKESQEQAPENYDEPLVASKDSISQRATTPSLSLGPTLESISSTRIERATTTIGWGTKEVKESYAIENQREVLKREKTKYLAELKKRKLDSQSQQPAAPEQELGPTQRSPIKGIFD